MIARIWHGKVPASKYEDYTNFMKKRALPDYQSTKGNLGLNFLRRLEKNEGHFTLITYWDSLESIRQFAGADIEKAKYYPEDENYLLEFEEKVIHYEVFASKSPV